MITKTNDYLDRFLNKQEFRYDRALEEIKKGKKESDWMWYFFPQLRGLGKSNTSFIYGIINKIEAKEYLKHPILGARLLEFCEALLVHKTKSAQDIFGYTDAKKLHSSMTLFALASQKDTVFHKVLNQFFDGKLDNQTISLLYDNNGCYIENGEFIGYYGNDEDIVIPYGVTSIHNFAFYKNKYIHSVTLPDSVLNIGENAFTCCHNLKSINIPTSVKNIGECAFSYCRSLADGNGFVIVKDVLYDCFNTEESDIVIPDGVTEIGKYAFSKCHRYIDSVVLPESVTTIHPLAFWGCEDISRITIPESVKAIALNAFKDCKNLTICAPADSYAEAYAHHLGIPFK